MSAEASKSNTPETYVVTLTCEVTTDSYRDLQRLTKEAREAFQRSLSLDPNTDGHYQRVHKVVTSIRPSGVG